MKRVSLEKRIFVTFSVVFFLLIFLICVIINLILRNNLIRQNRAYLNSFSASIAQQVASRLDDMNDMSVQLYYTSSIRNAFSPSADYDKSGNYFTAHPYDRNVIDGMMYSIAGTDITDIILNLYNDHAFYSSKYYAISWPSVKEALAPGGHLYEISKRLSQSQKPVVTNLESAYWTNNRYPSKYRTSRYLALYRNFINYTTNKNIGYVELLLPVKFLDGIFSVSAPDQTTIVADANDDILYRYGAKSDISDDEIKKALSSINSLDADSALKIDSETSFYGFADIDKYNLRVITFEPYDGLVHENSLWIIALAGLLLYAASMTACMLISRRLTEPLNQIVDSLRGVSWDTLEMSLSLDKRYGDFDVLEQAYKAMTRKLHESINLTIASRLNEQKATYLALQSQISPHFLYNVIANISALAYENGVDKIVDICEKLSGLLRYATDYSDSLSSVERELEYTENYLELMKIRYENRFMYSISASDDCRGFAIPRLITQTIIENCFKHSFNSATPPWYISVKAYVKDGWWFIEITYNGDRIDGETLNDIMQKSLDIYRNYTKSQSVLKIGGLGLVNSITRLRMLCDNEMCFEVFTSEDSANVTRFGGKIK